MNARECPVEQGDQLAADAVILAGLRERSPNALTLLVNAHSTRLTRAAWLYLGDAHAAQDAAQDALIAAWDGARRTTPRTVLEAWLMGILINCCRKHVRASTRRRRREVAVMQRRAKSHTLSEDPERLMQLQKSLELLDAPQRELIILRYHERLSVEQTAAALGIPAGTVKSRCHAAITRLRQLMEDAHESR